jgi:hypothetical protein
MVATVDQDNAAFLKPVDQVGSLMKASRLVSAMIGRQRRLCSAPRSFAEREAGAIVIVGLRQLKPLRERTLGSLVRDRNSMNPTAQQDSVDQGNRWCCAPIGC